MSGVHSCLDLVIILFCLFYCRLIFHISEEWGRGITQAVITNQGQDKCLTDLTGKDSRSQFLIQFATYMHSEKENVFKHSNSQDF